LRAPSPKIQHFICPCAKEAKYVIELDDNNKISFLLAGAEDFAEAELTEKAGFVAENPDFAGDALLGESFDSQGITWQKQIESGGELELSIAKYRDKERMEFGENYFLQTTFDDSIFKGYWLTPVSKNHNITLGFEINNYDFEYAARLVLFVCSEFDINCQEGRGEIIEDERVLKVKDTTAYITDHWQMTGKLGVDLGLQVNKNDYTDETFYNPRIGLEWQVWPSTAIVSSAGRYNRFPDIDTVLPEFGNPELKSPTADHFTLGLKGEMNTYWDWNVEFYHKNLDQLPLALDSNQEDADQLYSNDIKGSAKGVDVFINRNLHDKWYGWLALSYARSDRTNKRNNETRDYFLDTPLVLNMVANYQLNNKWDAGFRFTTKSGQASTKIIDVKPNPNFPDSYLPVYSDPYQDRLPTYAQLDVRFERDTPWFGNEGSFYIDILNATDRKNVDAVELDYEKVNEDGTLHTKKVVGFGVFPSIGFSVTF